MINDQIPMTNKCRIVLTLPSPTLMQLPPRLDRVEPPLLGKDGKEYNAICEIGAIISKKRF
jgi:hypothetical protein